MARSKIHPTWAERKASRRGEWGSVHSLAIVNDALVDALEAAGWPVSRALPDGGSPGDAVHRRAIRRKRMPTPGLRIAAQQFRPLTIEIQRFDRGRMVARVNGADILDANNRKLGSLAEAESSIQNGLRGAGAVALWMFLVRK